MKENSVTLIHNGKIGSKFASPYQWTGKIKEDPQAGIYVEFGGLIKGRVFLRSDVIFWERISDPKRLATLTGAAIGARYGGWAGGAAASIIGMSIGSLVSRSQGADKVAIALHAKDKKGSVHDYIFMGSPDTIAYIVESLPRLGS